MVSIFILIFLGIVDTLLIHLPVQLPIVTTNISTIIINDYFQIK